MAINTGCNYTRWNPLQDHWALIYHSLPPYPQLERIQLLLWRKASSYHLLIMLIKLMGQTSCGLTPSLELARCPHCKCDGNVFYYFHLWCMCVWLSDQLTVDMWSIYYYWDCPYNLSICPEILILCDVSYLSSASGGLKVCSVDSKGYFVKVVNTGDHPELLNGCSIQQSINDRLIAAFKFPNGVTIEPGQTITVSECAFACIT